MFRSILGYCLIFCVLAPFALATLTGLSTGAMSQHPCAVLGNGSVRCWGADACNDLGYSSSSDLHQPNGVDLVLSSDSTNPTAVAVVGGYNHTCVLTTAGEVYCFGCNDEGQLGNGGLSAQALPTQPVPLITDAAGVTVGAFHTCVWNATVMMCFGLNDAGQVCALCVSACVSV